MITPKINITSARSPSPRLVSPRHTNLIQQEKQETYCSDLFENKSKIQIIINSTHHYYIPKQSIPVIGVLEIVFIKNRESVNKGKSIQLELDETLIKAFEHYITFVNDTRSLELPLTTQRKRTTVS